MERVSECRGFVYVASVVLMVLGSTEVILGTTGILSGLIKLTTELTSSPISLIIEVFLVPVTIAVIGIITISSSLLLREGSVNGAFLASIILALKPILVLLLPRTKFSYVVDDNEFMAVLAVVLAFAILLLTFIALDWRCLK